MALLADARALSSRCVHWLEAWPPLRRLDRWQFDRALFGGVVLGLVVGAALGLLQVGDAQWLVAMVIVALAGAVAWSGQPVGIWESAVDKPEPLLDMVGIEGGSFLMGSPEDEVDRVSNEKQHRVTLSPFRMSRTAITRAQYLEVMELDETPGQGGGEHPITEVSWHDAVTFCNRLSEHEDLSPCYGIDGDQVAWVKDAGGYRLPTEAEWEYAARAGSMGRWSFGEDESELGRYAWFGGNSDRKAHPVATRESNAWGLHDMHGNVWEWCWDRFGTYGAGTASNPRGPSDLSPLFWRLIRRVTRPIFGSRRSPGAHRVLRGGSFGNEPRDLRSACWVGGGPKSQGTNVGFRCVRRPARQA